MPKVIVHGPWSRRRVVTFMGGLAGTLAALKLAVWAAESSPGQHRSPPLSGAVDDPPPPVLPTPSRALTLALPISVSETVRQQEAPLHETLRQAVAEVDGAANGRYHLLLEEVQQPPGRPAIVDDGAALQAQTLALLVASGAPPDLLLFTSARTIAGVSTQAAPPGLTTASWAKWLRPLDGHLRSLGAFGSSAAPIPFAGPGGTTNAPGGAGRNNSSAGVTYGGRGPLADFYVVQLGLCRHRGQVLALPLQSAPLLLWYDPRRLARAEITPPAPTDAWTWSEIEDAARALTRDHDGNGDPDEYGLFVNDVGPSSLLSVLWQHDAEAVSADGTQALLDRPEARRALEFFAGLHRPTSPNQPPAAFAPPPGRRRQWDADGMTVAHVTKPWWLAMAYQGLTGYHDLWGGALRVAPLPRGRRQAVPVGVRATLSLAAGAPFPDAAAAALHAIVERVTQRVELPPRRRPPAALAAMPAHDVHPDTARRALDPALRLAAAQTVVESLEHGRALVLEDLTRTMLVRESVVRLANTLQERFAPVDQAISDTNREIQKVLDGR